MGRDETTRTATLRPTSFNPRAHVGRDATYSMIARWQTSFNPRARVGRDLRRHGRRAAQPGFNPRARVGRDLACQVVDIGQLVSIHAPAWGATPCASLFRRLNSSFNPRARVGRDTLELMHAQVEAEFQSTRPRGARRNHPPDSAARSSFNPRARVGRDAPGSCAWWPTPSFNPRARVGRDTRFERRSTKAFSFNPRARVGRDSTRTFRKSPRRCFNPRARVGRDFAWEMAPATDKQFQSTRPRGARLSPNWTNTNYSTKQSYIQAATKLTKITRPAVPQFCCQGTRANIVINQHHLPFARHRARRLAKPQGHKVSSHQNAPPFFANSSRGYIHAGYLLTHQ